MLRLRDVYYEEYEEEISNEEKKQTIASLPEPTDDTDFVESLYLNGSR